ncbi:HNH endonuclease [Methylobacterium currus]|nr:HNH endonuclease [Methylobacterium currus]
MGAVLSGATEAPSIPAAQMASRHRATKAEQRAAALIAKVAAGHTRLSNERPSLFEIREVLQELWAARRAVDEVHFAALGVADFWEDPASDHPAGRRDDRAVPEAGADGVGSDRERAAVMTEASTPTKRRARRPDEMTRFREWLTANGAEVLAPTNEWEVVRFRGDQGVSIVYRNATKSISRMTGQAAEALATFRTGGTMRFVSRGRTVITRAEPLVRALVERDGAACFYCDESFTDALPPTREHLLSRTHGGPDHIANQALACEPCNRRAGHLSLVEKIRLRDRLRAERSAS